MASRTAALILGIALVLSGCAGLSGGSVRKLSELEKDYYAKLQERMKSNAKSFNESLDDLLRLAVSSAEDEHSLSLSISKAKLLESMKAPWSSPGTGMVATQKAVVLYHLYDLAEASQSAFHARVEERRGAIRALKEAYTGLAALLDQAAEAQKLLLAYLDQPASARASAFVGNVLTEASAFRERLDESQNPELKALAARTGQAVERVAKAKEQVDNLLKLLSR